MQQRYESEWFSWYRKQQRGKEILICNVLKCRCLLEKAQLDLTLGAAAALELLPNSLEITKASSASDDVLSLGFNSSGVRRIDIGG